MRGVIVPAGLPWPELANWAAAHDGEESIWSTDPDVDPILQLSALSQLTRATRLGLRAESIADRPPLLASKQLVTLDHLSQGRLVVAGDFELHELCEPDPFRGELATTSWADVELGTS